MMDLLEMHKPKGLSKDPVDVRTIGLEYEPAVRAWRELDPGHAIPARLELLRRRKKSVIYRLPGAGREGSDVIAKQCLWQIASDERAVYEVLQELPEVRLGYYGFVAEPSREFAWLFLEDARGDPWDPSDAEHCRLAARWLASLHTSSSHDAYAARLPDRGPGYFLDHLRNARRKIRAGFGNPALAPEHRPVLDAMLVQLDFIEGRWAQVEAIYQAMPRALVHGDFAERNVRIRREGATQRLFAFDWEAAGWGLPGVDLACLDLAVYESEVRPHWPALGPRELERLAGLGGLLRGGIAAVSWESEFFTTTWVQGAVRNFSTYHRRILRALGTLGWHTTEAP